MRIIVRGQELFFGDIIKTVDLSTGQELYRRVEWEDNMEVGRIQGTVHYLPINQVPEFEVVYGKNSSKENSGLVE